ncbi:hypothetical protein DL767_007918 [Monosporascus sp. MG133]|nr:hypothetical protein DL767_007918 [Monosporascus sp. MG133]
MEAPTPSQGSWGQWHPQPAGGQNAPQVNAVQQTPTFDSFRHQLDVYNHRNSHPYELASPLHEVTTQALQHQQRMVSQFPMAAVPVPIRPVYETDRNNPHIAVMHAHMVPYFPVQEHQGSETGLDVSVAGYPVSTQISPMQYSPTTPQTSSSANMCASQLQPHQHLRPTPNTLQSRSMEIREQTSYATEEQHIDTSSYQPELTPARSLSIEHPSPHPVPPFSEQNHQEVSTPDDDWCSPVLEAHKVMMARTMPVYFIPSGDFFKQEYSDPSMQMPGDRINDM